jgi:hypothetical protein
MAGRPPFGRINLGTLSPATVKPVEDSIKSAMTDKLKSQLGVQSLSQDMDRAIQVAAATAAQQTVELGLVKVAEEASRDIGRASVLTRFDDKLQLAANSIGHIVASNDVDRVLKNRAELLAKKKKTLVDAGFSDEEAMDILLADIAARGH